MTYHQVRREAFLLQCAQHLGDGGSARDAAGVVSGHWDVGTRVSRVERIGSHRYDLRSVVAGRHKGEELMPGLLPQRNRDLEELPGKILMQEHVRARLAPPALPRWLTSSGASRLRSRSRKDTGSLRSLGAECNVGSIHRRNLVDQGRVVTHCTILAGYGHGTPRHLQFHFTHQSASKETVR